MALHRKTIQYLSGGQINKMSDARLDHYLERAETLLKQNMKQYEKPQKQWGGKTAKEIFDFNYGDMQYIISKDKTTREEKEEKLKDIARFMRKGNYTPTEARAQIKELSEGVFSTQFGKRDIDYIHMSQGDRRIIYENVGSIFANFTEEEISKLGSDEIVSVAAKYYSKKLGYSEANRRAKVALRNQLRSAANQAKQVPKTPRWQRRTIKL